MINSLKIKNIMISITIIFIINPIKTGTSFFGSSFVPSRRMKGMKKAPIPVTMVYSIIHICWMNCRKESALCAGG